MDVSIIIVNYNTRDLLRDCLESAGKTVSALDYEVVVVDNASRDGSVEMLRREYPSVRVIANETNRGFGAANNQALRLMEGRYALLLNSDTILKENAVQALYDFMEDHPDAAMACGQLLNADGSKQNSVAAFPTLLTLAMNMPVLEYLFPGQYPSKRYPRHEPVEVDSCIGACMIVRKEAIDRVGGFDERYFFFFEETDWALRMRKAGWKVYHVPEAFIYHLQGKSVGADVRSRYHFYRSRYQYFKKWGSPLSYSAARVMIFARLAVNGIFSFLACALTLGSVRALRNRSSVYAKLILWHLQGCPETK